MARGGKRQGAGRKPTASALRSRAIADKMADGGVMPLEIIVTAMREDWDKYRDLESEAKKDADKLPVALAYRKSALQAASDAAPYLHPKLAPVDAKTGEVAKFVIIDPTN